MSASADVIGVKYVKPEQLFAILLLSYCGLRLGRKNARALSSSSSSV